MLAKLFCVACLYGIRQLEMSLLELNMCQRCGVKHTPTEQRENDSHLPGMNTTFIPCQNGSGIRRIKYYDITWTVSRLRAVAECLRQLRLLFEDCCGKSMEHIYAFHTYGFLCRSNDLP